MIELTLGPILPEEASVLTALTRMVAAKTAVEFGYFWGTSARAILSGLTETGKLYSFDIQPVEKVTDDRLTLIINDMKTFKPKHVDNRKVDLVFFDASHVLNDNMLTFKVLEPSLSDEALIVVHDTGWWNTELYDNDMGKRVGNKRIPCPDEHKFIKYLQEKGYSCINLRSMRELRHGLSILQKGLNGE